MNRDFVKVKEAAALLRTSTTSIWGLIRRGELTVAHSHNGRALLSKQALIEWKAKRQGEGK